MAIELSELTDKEAKLVKKTQKDFPEFTEIVDQLSAEQLDQKLLEYAKYREETLQAQDKDVDLIRLKEELAQLKGPYSDTLRALKAKSAYLHLLLQGLR